MKFRPIEKIRQIVQAAIGLDIMYAYDDLAFSEYGAYLFQFDDENENNLICLLQKDFEEQENQHQIDRLSAVCSERGFNLDVRGRFELSQQNEEVTIKFLKS